MTLSFDNVAIGVYTGVITGSVALIAVLILLISLLNSPKKASNEPRMERSVEIAGYIQQGAAAFLRMEYFYIFIFIVIVFILISLSPYLEEHADNDNGWKTGINFLVGSFLSGLAGWVGMFTAVRANVRTTAAATEGLNPALKVAFKSGTIMGLTVVSFGILGLSVTLTIFLDPAVLAGFGFGASSIALFARVGGGIFTKAADVGADLVGKVANDMNEDDPRNPAVIADNVGDNVGDVAGMGADLFESYVGSIIACLTLAQDTAKNDDELTAYSVYPFLIAGGGIFCSIIGTWFVSVKEGGKMNDLLWALRRGLAVASLLVVIWSAVACKGLVYYGYWEAGAAFKIFGCVLIGLFAGVIIGSATEYCTSFEYYPTQSIALSGHHGHAPVIIQGMGVGMLSTIVPVLVVTFSILGCTALAGLYGIGIAGVGMLSTLGITLATDAYGPVADNAGGIAEMSELDEHVRATTDSLDALGNTTAATGKGFAIGSAVLTAVALMAAFIYTSQIPDGATIDIMEDVVIPGILVGAMLPFVFAALTMLSVRRGAHSIMDEVKSQFAERAKVIQANGNDSQWKPDYNRCVSIATQASVLEMVIPGSMAVFCPVIVGFALGAKALAAMLVGAIASGFLLAVTMANAGGAWDNAKKYVEAGHIPGHKKRSELHKATVTGDTVGDPFKDTSGPSLNILIKLMCIVSLVFAPVFPYKPYEDIGIAIVILVLLGLLSGLMACLVSRNTRAQGYKKLDEGIEMK
jgi:H(+)-translocating pyrophosphatase